MLRVHSVLQRAKKAIFKKGQIYLLWVEDFDDLCDSSLVECWDHITARGEKLQLECLTKQKIGHTG